MIITKFWRSPEGRVVVNHKMYCGTRTLATISSQNAPPRERAARKEGNIMSVFSTGKDTDRPPLPARFSDLKHQLWKDSLADSWRGVLGELKVKTDEVARRGSEIIPKVDYTEIQAGLSAAKIAEIKEAGVVVVRGAVAEKEALAWKESIRAYIKQNSTLVKGAPQDNIVFYELYNTKAQIEARTHPAILNTQRALLSLWRASDPETEVSLTTPISYFDRLRIRNPGLSSFVLGPHIDGGGVERWEDVGFRSCFGKILKGGDAWKEHDPYDVSPRLTAKQDLYNAPNQCTIFRPWQGWTALSDTRSSEGTLRVLPFVKLSTAYIILRPFFKPRSGAENSLEAKDWELNLDGTEFPGSSMGKAQELRSETHPHLRLNETVVSIDRVQPGDQVYWHCDGVHAVEAEHTGSGDSSVFYIPAAPLTRANADYLRDQRSTFEKGLPAPDYPGGEGESEFKNRFKPKDIPVEHIDARRVLGLERFSVGENETAGGARAVKGANSILFD